METENHTFAIALCTMFLDGEPGCLSLAVFSFLFCSRCENHALFNMLAHDLVNQSQLVIPDNSCHEQALLLPLAVREMKKKKLWSKDDGYLHLT